MSTNPELVEDPEEHEPVPDGTASPEDYDPEVDIDDPVREADPADVAEQNLEVPEEDESTEPGGGTDAEPA